MSLRIAVLLATGWRQPIADPMLEPLGRATAVSSLEDVLVIVGIIGAVAPVALRLWRTRGEERQQIKWVVYAGSVVVVGALGSCCRGPQVMSSGA